jgi:hypothetical protein
MRWLWFGLVLWIASGAFAQERRVVLLLEPDQARGEELREALALELEAQSMVLVQRVRPSRVQEKPPPQPPAAGEEKEVQEKPPPQPPAAGEEKEVQEQEQEKTPPPPPPSAEERARQEMKSLGVEAALWLQADGPRSVTWLRTVTARDESVQQAPLPYPPDQIEPRLFAIAGASLLEQVLRSAAAVGPKSGGAEKKPPKEGVAPGTKPKVEHKVIPLFEVPEPKEELPRVIFNFGIAFGFSVVRPGMEADSSPPGGDRAVYVRDETDPDYLTFRTDTSWIPDADSWERNPDGFSNTESEFRPVSDPDSPIGDECPSDGEASGPGVEFPNYLPTRYCVRVDDPGLVYVPALRVEAGYWVLPRLALSAIIRFQIASGRGTLPGVLLGGRAEYLLTAPESDFGVSAFGGATVGQIQPRPDSGSDNPPFIATGPGGVHAGMGFGFWAHRHVGFFIAPEVDFLFPRELLHFEIATGVKTRFP